VPEILKPKTASKVGLKAKPELDDDYVPDAMLYFVIAVIVLSLVSSFFHLLRIYRAEETKATKKKKTNAKKVEKDIDI